MYVHACGCAYECAIFHSVCSCLFVYLIRPFVDLKSHCLSLSLPYFSLCILFIFSFPIFHSLCVSVYDILSLICSRHYLSVLVFLNVCLSVISFPLCYYLSVCWLAHVLLLSSTVKPPSCPMKMSNFRNHFSPANSFVVSEANFDLFQLFQSVRHK